MFKKFILRISNKFNGKTNVNSIDEKQEEIINQTSPLTRKINMDELGELLESNEDDK